MDCLARETGRVWLLAKGAQRPKSPFLGQLDLFYTCEVVFYPRASRVLVMKECAALETRDALRENWRAAACASYFCDFTSQVTPPGVPHDDLFDLLAAALDALAEKGASTSLLCWYELAALKTLGLGLSLRRCPSCGRDPAADGALRLKVSSRQGGVLCKRCQNREPGSPARSITAGALAMLRAWETELRPQTASITVPTAGQAAEIQALLGDFVAYHLDFQLRSRVLTLEILQKTE